MEFSTKVLTPEKLTSPAIVIGVYEGGKLSASAERIDKAAKGIIARLIKSRDFEPKLGTIRTLYKPQGLACERLIVVGLGKSEEFGPRAYRESVRAATTALKDTGAAEAHLFFIELPVKGCDLRWSARQAVLIVSETLYRFEEFKSKKASASLLKRMLLAIDDKSVLGAINEGISEGRAIATGMSLTKDLGNRPSNFCTPTHLAEQATALAREYKFGIEVLERKDMEKLGMGALLAVARGSHQPPKFIVLRYNGGSKKDKPIVLVGKGVTFDTGGISIKPSAEMDEMKFDMCGAASVLGTFRALAELKPKLNVVGLIAATENMPGGNATKPGDIVKNMSGQTIEILNTDAEGRLILCDALSYAERFEPAAVIDIATLTGACVIALGHIATGAFSNNEALVQSLLEAGREAWDRAWHMPLWEEYQEQIRSPFADMANIGGRPGGSITAACFLSRYAEKYPWAHLDIAGTAWNSGKNKGATGRPVPLLVTYLLHQARQA
ncbi:MAG TPA: leucyl aminopeptidase [Burkholderiales bacterium]|nr:leucyl aminopeptidase [Burkholderiales bacterium]